MSSDTPRRNPKRQKYRATMGEHSIDLEIDGSEAVVDGKTRTVSAETLSDGRISLIVDGRSISADVFRADDGRYLVHIGGREIDVSLQTEKDLLLERFGLADAAAEGLRQVRAPMPGLVLSLHVAEGDEVGDGDSILVLEAMKMENELRAPGAGTVKAVHVATGDAVGKNDLLIEIEA